MEIQKRQIQDLKSRISNYAPVVHLAIPDLCKRSDGVSCEIIGDMSDESTSSAEDLHDFMEEKIKIDGLENAAREKDLSAFLQKLDGIRNVTIASGTVFITYDPTAISAKEIHAHIRCAGFTPGAREIAPSAPPIP